MCVYIRIFIKVYYVCPIPANIRLDEDVLIKTNMLASALRPQKTSSRRLQDVLVKTIIFVLPIRLQDVFKTFSRRLQDIFKTF